MIDIEDKKIIEEFIFSPLPRAENKEIVRLTLCRNAEYLNSEDFNLGQHNFWSYVFSAPKHVSYLNELVASSGFKSLAVTALFTRENVPLYKHLDGQNLFSVAKEQHEFIRAVCPDNILDNLTIEHSDAHYYFINNLKSQYRTEVDAALFNGEDISLLGVMTRLENLFDTCSNIYMRSNRYLGYMLIKISEFCRDTKCSLEEIKGINFESIPFGQRDIEKIISGDLTYTTDSEACVHKEHIDMYDYIVEQVMSYKICSLMKEAEFSKEKNILMAAMQKENNKNNLLLKL